MKIGILAVQGAFIEHQKKLESLGAQCVEIRQKSDLERVSDGLVLPGGESTVQGKLLRELDMLGDLRSRIEGGLPVLATCAGLILLAKEISNDDHVYLGTLPVTVERNAYGRQLGSFRTVREMEYVGQVPMVFIRAPYIKTVGKDVEVLAEVDGRIVAVGYGKPFAMAFHPELNEDSKIHEMFLKECRREQQIF